MTSDTGPADPEADLDNAALADTLRALLHSGPVADPVADPADPADPVTAAQRAAEVRAAISRAWPDGVPPASDHDAHPAPPPAGDHDALPPAGDHDAHAAPPPAGDHDAHAAPPPAGDHDAHAAPPPGGGPDRHSAPPPAYPQHHGPWPGHAPGLGDHDSPHQPDLTFPATHSTDHGADPSHPFDTPGPHTAH
jgi:hypothetical protein